MQTTWKNEGEGVAETATILHNRYFVTLSSKGKGNKIAPNSVHVVLHATLVTFGGQIVTAIIYLAELTVVLLLNIIV